MSFFYAPQIHVNNIHSLFPSQFFHFSSAFVFSRGKKCQRGEHDPKILNSLYIVYIIQCKYNTQAYKKIATRTRQQKRTYSKFKETFLQASNIFYQS